MSLSRGCPAVSPASTRRVGLVKAPGVPKFGLTAHGKIDLGRGLLAWLVVLCHASSTARAVHPSARSMTAWEYALLDHTVNAGFVWVMGFFVLSGYCIHLAVERRLAAPAFPLKLYLAARFSRILPVYYLALAFAVIAEPFISIIRTGAPYGGLDVSGLVEQLFLVQNLTHHLGSFTPSWSLTNEVFYYLLYGVLAATMGRHRSRPLLVGLGLCVVIGGLLQLAYSSGYRATPILKVGLLFGLGFNWFLGVGVAVFREEIGRSRLALAASRSWPIVLGSAFAVYHWGLPIQTAYLVGGVGFALLLARVVATPGPESGVVEPAWATRLVRFAGLSSYPTYLFHFTFMWLLAEAMDRWNLVGHWSTMMGVLVVSSLALGGLLGWYLERPIMRWRSGFLARLEAVESSTRLVSVPVAELGLAGLGKESR
jgi:peptidoglycan/LPS O-acetylase OafA/YrhL